MWAPCRKWSQFCHEGHLTIDALVASYTNSCSFNWTINWIYWMDAQGHPCRHGTLITMYVNVRQECRPTCPTGRFMCTSLCYYEEAMWKKPQYLNPSTYSTNKCISLVTHFLGCTYLHTYWETLKTGDKMYACNETHLASRLIQYLFEYINQ